MRIRKILILLCQVILAIAYNTGEAPEQRDVATRHLMVRKSDVDSSNLLERDTNVEPTNSTTPGAQTTTATSLPAEETGISDDSDSERWGRGRGWYRGGGGGGWGNGGGCGGGWRRDASYWRGRYGGHGWGNGNGWNGGGGCYSSGAHRALPLLGSAFLMITTMMIMSAVFCV